MKKKLLFLVLSVLTLGAWAQTSPYTGVAVGNIVSGNDYYLYNVESGLWLQNNDRTTNDWHTRGQLGTRGIDFQLNADGGGYKINGKFGKGSINHENLYLDNNDNDVWVFESVSVGNVSNAVTISCSGTVLGARNYVRTYKAKNLFTEETESNYYLENQASESTKNNTWQIVTKEERLAKMGSATNQSPKDASWLIKSPDFANNDSRYSNWTRTGNWARGGDVSGDWGRGSMIMESWNSGSSVKISQTIADIPNGVYTLQLQGYYRDGMAGDNTDFNVRGCTNETCIEAKHNAGTEVIRAKYYANESEANLRSIIDETHTTAKTGPDCWNFTRLGNYYFPNDMQTAQRAMNIEKAYVNEPITVVVKDGKLEIGVEKTGSVAYDWVIIDNFKLTYYGFEEWNGTDDAILPSIKYGGSYSAHTKLFNADYDYGDGQTNNAHFNQIVGTPDNDGSSKAWYAADYTMTDWTYGNSALPNFGDGKPADIYVRRYFIVNNDLPSTVYMPAPHDDAPCEYYINGTLVWSRTGTEPGVNGWKDDEVVRLTDAQKALIHTDGTVNVFAFHVHQNWGGRYADGGLYGDAGTTGTPSKKFTENYPANLNDLVALCAEENIAGDATFQIAIDNAEACLNMLQNTSSRYDELVFARKRFHAEKVSKTFTGTTPANNGEYYLYNVGERKFLCGGNDWGAHASLGFAAHYVKLSGDSENGYNIKTFLLDTDPDHNKTDGQYLGYGGYMDSEPGEKWKFISQGDNKYNIVKASNESDLLGYDSGTVNNVITTCTTSNVASNQWMFITKAERDALLATATSSNGVDATFYIDNPGFDQRWTIESWEKTDMDINRRNDNHSDFVASGWNETNDGNTAENFYIAQTIEGLLPGLYEVSVQACYRHGGDATSSESVAWLFANDEKTKIKNVNVDMDKVPGDTNNGTDDAAINYFQYGCYKNTVRVVVGSNGELTLGVKRAAADFVAYDWLAADNFRLTYLGPVEVTVGSAGYTTFVAPYNISTIPDGVEAYACQVGSDYVHLEPVEAIPEGEAVVLKNTGTYSFSPASGSVELGTDNDLQASDGSVQGGENIYALAKKSGEVGFYRVESTVYVPAGKGYLNLANSVKAFYGFEEDGADGIEKTLSDSPLKGENIYNVAGQRISKMQKGVNIVNGRKVLF